MMLRCIEYFLMLWNTTATEKSGQPVAYQNKLSIMKRKNISPHQLKYADHNYIIGCAWMQLICLGVWHNNHLSRMEVKGKNIAKIHQRKKNVTIIIISVRFNQYVAYIQDEIDNFFEHRPNYKEWINALWIEWWK